MQKPYRYKLNTSSFKHYWTEGIGLDLLKKLNSTPDISNADQFVPYLFEYDALGDEIVNELHQKVGFKEGKNIIENYFENNDLLSIEQKTLLDNFFNKIDTEPNWLDKKLLQKGIEFTQRSGISGLIVLRDYCLMGGYESSAINKPLIYTGALKKGAVKRISETTEFWVDISANHALEFGKIGFKAIIKTRMIHSFARINILKSTDWDSNKWGIPLNTWDMLATNLGFSLVYMVGLRKMGIEANESEIKGLFHLWKYVGHLLGIPTEILPNNELEAIEALYYWTMTQADGDEDSKLLAKALQEEPIKAFYPSTHLGRLMMREIHLYYNYFLLGDYSCNLLGLEQTNIGKIAHLNIYKNQFQNRQMKTKADREKAISKGRKEHEEVKRIYLKYNSK